MTDIKKLLYGLTDIMSVTGFEKRGKEALFRLVSPYFDESYTDPTGNHIFIKKAKNNPKGRKILLDAHFDEVGMIVSGIHEGGFLTVAFMGGIDTGILPAGEVLIYGKETIHGVICATPPHLQKPGDSEKLPTAEEIRIDTGYDKEDLEEIAPVGTPIGFYGSGCETVFGRITGRGFDDKACAAAIIAAASDSAPEKLTADVYVSISAREEVGGAAPSLVAFGIKPDVAIVTDVGFARTPGTKVEQTLEYGSGAGISITSTFDRAVARRIIDIAKEKDIPLGLICEGTDMGTNAALLEIAMEGVPCVALCLPLGNMHTYNEALEISDLETLSRLVGEIICDEKIYEREKTL